VPAGLRDLGRIAEPVSGVGEQVGAPPLPGARWRDPGQVEPQRGAVDPGRTLADQLRELGAGQRAVGQPRAHAPGRRRHLGCGGVTTVITQPAGATLAANRERPPPPVARRDEMDRRPQQGPLDDGATLQRPGEPFALEALQPRPQTDVHRGRVLRLDAADALERLRQRRAPAREQQLAVEQGAVELALGQRALGRCHPRSLRRPPLGTGATLRADRARGRRRRPRAGCPTGRGSRTSGARRPRCARG
jgi:hypothetical protein